MHGVCDLLRSLVKCNVSSCELLITSFMPCVLSCACGRATNTHWVLLAMPSPPPAVHKIRGTANTIGNVFIIDGMPMKLYQ